MRSKTTPRTIEFQDLQVVPLPLLPRREERVGERRAFK